MTIREFTDDLNIIAGLDDEPNDVGGLTSVQLKAKFDEAGNAIQDYINDTLIPDIGTETDAKIAAAELASGNIPLGGAMGQALMKNSGTDHDAGWQTVTGVSAATPSTLMQRDANGRAKVANPVDAGDIVNKGYVDNAPRFAPWILIQSYTVAGVFTFTAPNLFGGTDYDIGVFIIGGGGSGAAACCSQYQNNIQHGTVTGGASGYTRCIILRVTPGISYNLVVGAKGNAVTATLQSQNYTAGAPGNPGGSSSFNGIVANGGAGGGRSSGPTNPPCYGAIGGQSSDYIMVTQSIETYSVAPAMGQIPMKPPINSSNFIQMDREQPQLALNPFNMKRYLGAGGAAHARGNEAYSANRQTAPVLDDGLKAGDGAVGTSAGAVLASAQSATSPGSGGGSAAAATSAITSGITVTATSGTGADGAVMIYARKAVV